MKFKVGDIVEMKLLKKSYTGRIIDIYKHPISNEWVYVTNINFFRNEYKLMSFLECEIKLVEEFCESSNMEEWYEES